MKQINNSMSITDGLETEVEGVQLRIKVDIIKKLTASVV